MSLSSLVDDMNVMLHTADAPSTDNRCIYKVPSVIRKHNEDAYTPNFVSIGPFHHGHPQLKNMERHKLIYFKDFLQRTNASLSILISDIYSILSDFKCCYSETLSFPQDEELVKLILIDSGFIIQLFWKYFKKDFLEPWLDAGIRSDLLLLENQLPFFVIEKIYGLSWSSTNGSFLELTINYFQYFNQSKLVFDNNSQCIRHFTDLIRIFHLQHPIESQPSRDKIDEQIIHLPSATQLLEAGVRFQVKPKSECLLDLGFSEGVLEIPRLEVEDGTEILFRNMVALEQCHYPYESYITDYVVVLDFLINTGKDADILVRKEILTNLLGDSDSVANLFNRLCKNVIHHNISSHFSILCKNLNAFCSNPWNRLKASLRRDYGKTPWQTAASVAGILLLVLTLLQSVCSVLQVVQAS
ncbi:hypothetical protein MtrunA17_Chr6g0457371 [Medicago truncatula]|uniref:DUF247 domain protein n=1 Tax=Medicago truncatula TaxID=3880 RepID=A0A072TJE2_MEDTR|nr:UPF0481 protein At3g47200 [Medicago truncatula]KEH17301.1 DUF247 domain protein [Medicago truncatula]RHN50435.1 hypothetical protein MtrunA17_Chr6g0457371 [Medicago truncatula]